MTSGRALSSRIGGTSGVWRNWAGNASAKPLRTVAPSTTEALAETVRRAAEDGLPVKAVGTGHSFTSIATTGGVLIRPERLSGVRRIDRAAGTVTVAAGTSLKQLNQVLASEGLSLANMGDIMEQTVAGATSTGTHGTGRDSASLSAQIVALEMVLADGEVLRCSHTEHREVFSAARLGIGALGVLTELTFAVEPIFVLTAREEPMRFARVAAEFDRLLAENEHFEFYWFPHTENCNTKRNNRTTASAKPLSAVRGWVDDELLSNGLFQAACSLGRAAPVTVPSLARISSRALSARTYSDIPYRVFTSPRRVRFLEMEYALPRESAMIALAELKTMTENSRLRVNFPVEVRTAPADDIPLSTANGRDTVYLATHVYRGTPHQAYFTAAERIMMAHGGRPHWGKLHSRDAGYLAGVYPRFAEFVALRDRLDPERRFGNDYLRRVLGA